MALLSSLLACGPAPLDALPAGSGANDLLLGWIERTDGDGWVELRVGGSDPQSVWRQPVGPEGRAVGLLSFDEPLVLTVSDPQGDTVLGEPWEVPADPASGIAPFGTVVLRWEVGPDLAPPNAMVDAHPGPPDGWLTPKREDAAPLRLGLAEAEAEAGWVISGRAIADPKRVMRGLGGLTREGAGVRTPGVAWFEGHRLLQLDLLFTAGECLERWADLDLRFGEPSVRSDLGATWSGARYQVRLLHAGNRCSVTFQERTYGPRPRPEPRPKPRPNSRVDAAEGPPETWTVPSVGGAPALRIGQPRSVLEGPWGLHAGARVPLPRAAVADAGRATLSFRDEVLQAIAFVRPDPACARTRADLEAAYGPVTDDDPVLGARWGGESTQVRLMPVGDADCTAEWSAVRPR